MVRNIPPGSATRPCVILVKSFPSPGFIFPSATRGGWMSLLMWDLWTAGGGGIIYKNLDLVCVCAVLWGEGLELSWVSESVLFGAPVGEAEGIQGPGICQ